MFSILESVAFDTGYAGSNGLEPQSWVNGNGTSYIYFGSGEFDGQGSGHDFYGTLYLPPSGYVNSCDGGRSLGSLGIMRDSSSDADLGRSEPVPVLVCVYVCVPLHVH